MGARERRRDLDRRVDRRHLVALVGAVLVAVVACGSTGPTPLPDTTASAAANASDDRGPAATTGPAATPAPPAVPSSADLVADAEREGRIDHDTALLYQLYAALDYGSLPGAYQSDNPAAADATSILAEVRLRLAGMSPEIATAVAPFLARPSDPSSIWSKRLATARAGGRLTAALDAAPVTLALATTPVLCPRATTYSQCTDVAGTPVRIWYPGMEDLGGTAAALAAEIDRSGMWALEQAAMVGHVPCTDEVRTPGRDNGGDGRLDVYLVPTGSGAGGLYFSGRNDRGVTLALPDRTMANGLTVPEAVDECGGVPFIVLNATREPDELAGTMAHELFHAFQFSFANSLEPDRSWWAEATATWARDLVYPEANGEWPYLDGFWSRAEGAEGPLDRFARGNGAAYAAYLWPFFLRQKLGSADGSEIGRLWKASETEDPIHVMEALPGWADLWKEFARWNWNQDSPELTHYRDEPDGGIPATVLTQRTACMSGDGCQARADESATSVLATGTHDVPIDARYASVQYLAAVPEVDVDALRFDLTQVAGKRGIGVQAILWIGNAPAAVRVEDWSDRPERRFCLASEDVRRIVLIVSNSAVDPVGDTAGVVKVEASSDGCPAITTATATYTEDVTVGGWHRWSRLTMAVTTADGRTTAAVDYQWDEVDAMPSGTRTDSVRGSGTVEADLTCVLFADHTVGVEASWTDPVPSTRTWSTGGGGGNSESSYLEFQGFSFKAPVDPGATTTAGTITEDSSGPDGPNIAVYTWSCPNPDRDTP